jgi:N-acetylneuraminic acid mutarotase
LNKSLVTVFFVTFLIVSVPALIVPGSAAAADSWIQRKPMAEPRGRLGVVEVNGKIYAIGGDNGSVAGLAPSAWASGTTAIVNANEEYNPETDTWISRTPIPTRRSHFGIAVYEGKIYCIGGQTCINDSQSITGANEVYNPATDTWESKRPMPIPGRFQIANVVNGKIIVTGSIDNMLNQEYNPDTDSWTDKTEPPYQISSWASTVYDNNLYFVCDSPSTSLQSILIYNPLHDSWNVGPATPSYLTAASAGVTSGLYAPRKIYFFDENATYVFDPQNNAWSTGVAQPSARGYSGVAKVNDTFYVVGGVILPGGFDLMSPTAVNEQYFPIGYGDQIPVILDLTPYVVVLASAVAICIVVVFAVRKRRHPA